MILWEPTAIGFDLSLTSAGVAVVGSDGMVTYTFGRKGKRHETLEERLGRLELLASQCVDVILEHIEHPKIATIEEAFNSGQGSAFDRAGLFWFVARELRIMNIPTVLVHNTKVKIYATGRGSGLEKDQVLLATARRHHDVDIQNNDQADALNLALIGARLIGKPVDGEIPEIRLRAMNGLELP
jgi:Holliday junction resolvasome RuvABC endonuclease subunit